MKITTLPPGPERPELKFQPHQFHDYFYRVNGARPGLGYQDLQSIQSFEISNTPVRHPRGFGMTGWFGASSMKKIAIMAHEPVTDWASLKHVERRLLESQRKNASPENQKFYARCAKVGSISAALVDIVWKAYRLKMKIANHRS